MFLVNDTKRFSINGRICYSYVSRTSLQDYMDSEHPLMFSVVCALAIDVITALGYLHEKKICHNNINTRTILVTDNVSSNKFNGF